MSKKYPKVVPGSIVKVHQKIKETTIKGERERIQIFEGMVLGRSGSGVSETITVRKIASGIGVEKIFPIEMPTIENIEVVRQAKVRRAKLYYLKDFKKKLRFEKDETKIVFKKKKKKAVKQEDAEEEVKKEEPKKTEEKKVEEKVEKKKVETK
ncbi:MAG: 50S ribosomal protein L19 [Parcubacteria group bacterium]|nr:50S ribosomal protein L19 [Parcubacteria group bacterium]